MTGLSLRQVHHECEGLRQELDWPNSKLKDCLGMVYGKQAIEDLNFVQALRFREALKREWQERWDQNMADIRKEHEAEQQTWDDQHPEAAGVPYIFRGGGRG